MENQSKRVAKKTLINWSEAAQSAFEVLKELCVNAPILAFPNYKLPFILHTDSSTEGLGAVLYQKQEGKLRVIAYVSRSVTKTESNYPAHKLEFLALKWAICEKFHEYGMKIPLFKFIQITIHSLMSSQQLNWMLVDRDGLQSWPITISPFNIDLARAMLKQMLLAGYHGLKFLMVLTLLMLKLWTLM